MEDRERIITLEVTSQDHERRIRIQENQNENLKEIATYVKLQVEHNEKQDKQLETITGVMHDIHINLAGLNKEVSEMKDRVGDVTNRMDEIEEDQKVTLKNFKKNTINFYLKIIGGIILAVLLFWLNIK